MFLTKKYRCGFLHFSYIDGHEIIRVQVDRFAYLVQVKSEFSGKLLITKHFKSGKAL